jgi:uncharacterized protein YigA (DUF484 family)
MMAISPTSPLSQVSAPAGTATDPVLSAVADLQKGRLTLDDQIQKMKQTLIERQTPMFDPKMLKFSAAMLKPTKTGSAFEAFGNAADVLATEQDKDLERQYAQQKLGLELEEKGLGLKQKMAGFSQMQNMFNPQSAAPNVRPAAQPPMLNAQPQGTAAPAVDSTVVPMGTPKVDPDNPTGAKVEDYGFTIRPSAVDAGIEQTTDPKIVQTPLGPRNLSTMRPISERDIALAMNISPEQGAMFKELAAMQKDFRSYELDVAKFGVQQAELRLNERRTKVAEANLAIDQAKLKQTDFATIDFGVYGERKVALGVAQEWQKLLNEGDDAKINDFLKKNKITTFTDGRPQTESERKIALAGGEAGAKGEAESNTAFGKTLTDTFTSALDLEKLAKDQIALVEANPKVFNYLQDPTLKTAFFRAVSDMNDAQAKGVAFAPSQLVGYFQGLDKTGRDVLSVAAQKYAQVALAFAKLDMKGQGQISDGERRLIGSINALPSDSADAIRLKSEALQLRAQRDQAFHKAWTEFKSATKSNDRDQFLQSPYFTRMKQEYDTKFENTRQQIANLYGEAPANTAAPSGSLVDQLNSALGRQ